MDSAGAVVGSILAYLLWQSGLSYSSIFTVAAVLAIAALIPFKLVREQKRSPELPGQDYQSPTFRRTSENSWSSPPFSLSATSAICSSSCAPKTFFSGANAVAAPLLLYVLFNLVYAVLSMPMGIWSDRIGRKNVLTLGYAVFALTASGVCLCLLSDWAHNSLCSLWAGLCHNRCLAECLCLRSQPMPICAAHLLGSTMRPREWLPSSPALWQDGSGQYRLAGDIPLWGLRRDCGIAGASPDEEDRDYGLRRAKPKPHRFRFLFANLIDSLWDYCKCLKINAKYKYYLCRWKIHISGLRNCFPRVFRRRRCSRSSAWRKDAGSSFSASSRSSPALKRRYTAGAAISLTATTLLRAYRRRSMVPGWMEDALGNKYFFYYI